eukprot:GHRR01007159.1.p1 GENE.GHRR01007159.1~~GHRR01007159.1.p1  ORF type:complete len:274 (+),score=98.49 GHRR01007159.1:140-961(+)
MLRCHSNAALVYAYSGLLHQVAADVPAAAWNLAAAVRQQGWQQVTPSSSGTLWQQHRQKHTVRMVLLKDHPKLGKRGDIVTVKAGHARYTLFPQGLADYAIPSVLRDAQAQGLISQNGLGKLHAGFKQQRAAAAVDPADRPLEQQLPEIVKVLQDREVVVSRRFNRRHPEQPMLGEVTANHLAALTAQQLRVDLSPELIMMQKGNPIKQFGSYKVPLNLKNDQGEQLELEVMVRKTYRSDRVRQHAQRLFVLQQQQQSAGQQSAGQQSAGQQA